MATCVSTLPKLESFVIGFQFPTLPLLHQRRNLSPTRTRFVLSALTKLNFTGASEYLEALAARIDAPLLDEFQIDFFHQRVFDIPQTIRFFGHLNSFRPSCLTFLFCPFSCASIQISSESSQSAYPSSWQITSKTLDKQVMSVAQICRQILPFRSSVKSLIITSYSLAGWGIGADRTNWSQLFHSFTSVRSLVIPAMLEPTIAAALQALPGEFYDETFPSLCNLSIVCDMWYRDETVHQGIQSFIAARQHDGRPIALSRQLSTL